MTTDFNGPLDFDAEVPSDFGFDALRFDTLSLSPVPGYVVVADASGNPIWVPASSITTTGAQGSVGPVGPPGMQGPQGDWGLQGPPGRDGTSGSNGATGSQGERGFIGPVGMEGPEGPPGPRGEQGPTGDTGATGATGARGLPGSSIADTAPTSANAMDDEFDDSAGQSGPINGLDAKWAWRNQSTSVLTYSPDGFLKIIPPTSATDALRGIEQVKPAAQDYTVVAKVSVGGVNNGNTALGGLWFVDSVNGDLYIFNVGITGAGVQLFGGRYNSVTSFNSTVFTALTTNRAQEVYLKSEYVNGTTTFNWWYSYDGVAFIRIASFVDAVVHTRVGLVVNESTNTGLTVMHCDWFRRTA